MLIQRIYHFLTAGTAPTDSKALRTVIMANAFLTIGAFTFAFFAYVNLVLFHSYFIGILDALASAISIGALIDYRLHKNLNRTVWIGSVNFFLFFITFASSNQNNDFGLIWTIFFPIFVITLMGHRQGLWLTLLFYLILFTMAYTNIGVWDNETWNLRSYLRFMIASLVLTYVIYVYEAALDHSHQNLLQTRQKELKYLEELERLSTTDPLTGLSNRRHMDQIIETHFSNAKRYSTPFTLMIFDIDNFKQINDTYGHNVGDDVLISIADLARLSFRKTDYIARWGGEEFLVLLPQTSLQDAAVLAEKLRQRIEESDFTLDSPVTCSFGVTRCQSNLDIYELIDRADNALYQAKETGKNRVCIYEA